MSINKAKQKGNLFFSFWAKPKKNEQVKKEVVVFLKQKGNNFFHFEPLKKKDKKTKFLFLFTKCTALNTSVQNIEPYGA